MVAALGALAAGAMSFAGNQVSSAVNSRRAWKYTQRAMVLQDKYNRNFYKWSSLNGAGYLRQGYANAGYNPLLALPNVSPQGAIYNPSSMNSDSDAGDQAVNSAMSAMSLPSQIENTKSQTAVNESNSALAQEQAQTEKSKRTNLEFQNAMLDVQKHLADKDLSWYDRKAYASLYNQFQQAESYRASSAIGAMNAETNRQRMLNDYSLGKYHNETERNRAGWQNYKDYHDSKYGNPLKTAGFAWDKNTASIQGMPDFWKY